MCLFGQHHRNVRAILLKHSVKILLLLTHKEGSDVWHRDVPDVLASAGRIHVSSGGGRCAQTCAQQPSLWVTAPAVCLLGCDAVLDHISETASHFKGLRIDMSGLKPMEGSNTLMTQKRLIWLHWRWGSYQKNR